MGRPSLFGKKDVNARYQGLMTTVGSRRFETTRKHIAAFVGIPVDRVSDGDVFDYLARGKQEAEKVLARLRT